MKKGLHIVCASGLVLAVSIAAIGCQKNTGETVPGTTVPMTETIIELAEDGSTEPDKETSVKQDKETKKEAKEDKKEDLKGSKKENSKKEDKKETSQKETQKPAKSETDSSKPQKPTETQKPSKPTGTQKPSKPAETQKPSKPSETKPQKPAETQKPSKPQEPQKPAETKPQHQHNWAAKTELITHPEEGHYETVVVKEAWDEPIYESHNFCTDCGADITNKEVYHFCPVSEAWSYHSERVQVGSKHHDAVTQQQWVVDKKAWYESVIVGYECQCGATK